MIVDGHVLAGVDLMLSEKARDTLVAGWHKFSVNNSFYVPVSDRGTHLALTALGLLTYREDDTGFFSFTKLGAEYVKGLLGKYIPK